MRQLSEAIQQGKELVEQLRLAEAVSYFETLLAQPGEQQEARIWLARVALMVDDFTSAEGLLKIVLATDPANVEALALQGIYHIKQGQYEKAGRVLETARKHDPELAMVYPNLALVYREAGLPPESLKAATQGVRLLPDDPQARLEVARTFWSMDQSRQAVSHALRALELDPLYLFAYFDLGGWLVSQGKQEAAIELYLEGIRHAPDAWPLREQLASLYVLAQKPQEAAVHAGFLVAHRGSSRDHILFGDCLAAAGDLEGAESAYKEAVKVGPNNSEVHLRLADLYSSTNRIDEAEDEYLGAASAEVSYLTVNELGLFLLRQSRFEEAAEILESALKLDPNRQEAKMNLALCYAALERKHEATDLAREVSANRPEDDPMRKEADRLMAVLA